MVAPNLSALIGEVVGARLISHAGEVPLMLAVHSSDLFHRHGMLCKTGGWETCSAQAMML